MGAASDDDSKTIDESTEEDSIVDESAGNSDRSSPLASGSAMEEIVAESEKSAEQLALEGNPEFVYDKVYLPGGTKVECTSYKCFKCPTSVDKMERLESHLLSHGANKKFKCKYCDFSVDQMHVTLRHEESHRAQKQKKQALLEQEIPSHSPSSVSNTPRSRISSGSTSERNRDVTLSSPKSNGDDVMNDQDEADIEIDIDPEEEVDVGIDSGEEMELEEHEVEQGKVENDESMEENEDDDEDYGDAAGNSQAQSPKVNNKRQQQHRQGKTKTEPNSWNCQYCPAMFNFQSFKKRHEALHLESRPLKCTHCTYSTSATFALKEHLFLHEGPPQKKPNRSLSPALSITSNASSASRSRSRRSSEGSRSQIQDDTSDQYRNGNPKFTYAPQFRKLGYSGKMVEMPTYKCWKCPSAYQAMRDLNSHCARHGAAGSFQCKLCDYTHNQKQMLKRHLQLHSSQENGPQQLLPPQRTANAEGGYDIGDDNEVAIVGNENDFEIEVEDGEQEFVSEEDTDDEDPNSSTVTEQLCRQTPVEQHTSKPPTDHYALSRPDESVEPKSLQPETYLLVGMKVSNFMCFEDITFNFNSDVVTFSGGEGKSTSIIAMLLCLGYDLLIENYTPSVICGWEISDLIRRGREVAYIEITLCLKSYPKLLQKYGNELRIRRTLRRGVPLASSTFQVASDIDEAAGRTSPTSISISKLREILTQLGILPLYARLALLDRQNFKTVLSDKESWYDYFADAVHHKGKFLKSSLEKLTPLFERLEGDIKWRKTQLRFFEEQLQTDHPIDEDAAFLQWRNEDVKRFRQAKLDLQELTQKYDELEKSTVSYTDQLENVPTVILNEMRTIYLEFLASQNCIGDILVEDKNHSLRIWAREKYSTEDEFPVDVREADELWTKTSQAKKQTAVYGLYLGFWKVNDTCPFFAVDAYSSAELEFKFPAKALPVLVGLVRSKSGQQFLMSYPES